MYILYFFFTVPKFEQYLYIGLKHGLTFCYNTNDIYIEKLITKVLQMQSGMVIVRIMLVASNEYQCIGMKN